MNTAINTNIEDYRYFFIALVPVLALYQFIPLVNLGYLFLMLIIFIKVIKDNLIVEINIQLLLVMTAFILLNFFVGGTKYLSITSTLNNTAGMIVFTIIAIVLCCPGYIEPEKLYKACKVVSIAATLFLIYQFLAYNLLDVTVWGKIPFLTQVEDGFTSMENGRPNSFFYEPAHFIIYIMPVYAMSIIKKEYWLSIFLAIGTILSTSTTGFVLLFAIPVIIAIKNSISLIITSGVLLIAMGIISQLAVFTEQYLNKLGLSSLLQNTRLFGTLDYFQYFSIKEWIFGIGFNRLAEWLYLNGISYGRNYSNSVVFMMFSFGVIGFLIFIYLCVILYRNIQYEYRVMWFILMFILASDQIFFNRNFLYLIIWIYAVHKKEDEVLELVDSYNVELLR
ncbi:hypothetical protein Q5O24_11275 [Eubacteriaceae bacterium ES3]|nr:hypothetical protein Q5O24_11275 [Eubacteriaceae bacterium ES3]